MESYTGIEGTLQKEKSLHVVHCAITILLHIWDIGIQSPWMLMIEI